MKHIGIGASALLVLLILGSLLRIGQPAVAQEKTIGQKVAIDATFAHLFFATLSKDARLVRSGSHSGVGWLEWTDVPEGDYDLKIQAEGYEALNMPIHVAEGDNNKYSAGAKATVFFISARRRRWRSCWSGLTGWRPPSNPINIRQRNRKLFSATLTSTTDSIFL